MPSIFDINTEKAFKEACIETFLYQYEKVEIYQKFVDFLNINPKKNRAYRRYSFSSNRNV